MNRKLTVGKGKPGIVDKRLLSKSVYEQWSAEGGKSGTAMSTIEEVRAAEKRVQIVLEALKKADARDANDLSAELQKATDEYARAVRELSSK